MSELYLYHFASRYVTDFVRVLIQFSTCVKIERVFVYIKYLNVFAVELSIGIVRIKIDSYDIPRRVRFWVRLWDVFHRDQFCKPTL